jgi:predicted Zn-dependent protease
MLSTFLLVIALFAGIILSLFFAKDFFVLKLAEQAPVEWENKIGDKLFQGLSMQYNFIKNDSLTNIFKKVDSPLFQQIEKEGVKIDLYFTKDPTINAFALPGGKVIIHTGLIEKAKSWEEVLGVLGHELAHVTQHHHLRGVINNLGLYAVISTFFGDISAIAGTIANTGGELASLSNSRTFETEADEVGMHYLVQAKINNQGLISFFKILKKEHSNQLEKELAFLSTHPATDDRIQHLIALQKKIPAYQPIKFNVSFEAFQQLIEKQ